MEARLKIKRNDSGGSIIRLELAYDSPLGYIALDKDLEYATLEQINKGNTLRRNQRGKKNVKR